MTTEAGTETPPAATETPPADAGTTTAVVVETPPPAAEPPEPAADTTVVVAEGGDAEDAQDDATNLDHEHRLTQLEERFGTVESGLMDRPTYDDVRNMMPSPEAVEEVAASTAAAVAEAVAEEHEDEEANGEGETVRVEATTDAGDPVIATVEPETPPAADDETRKRGVFRW